MTSNTPELRNFWSIHSHSHFSLNDALPHVQTIVNRAVELDYPALGLTDHGSVTGSAQLYRYCRKVGIEPLPGIEAYVVPDLSTDHRKQTFHLTIAAYSETGYRNLCGLASLGSAQFYYRPRLDFANLAQLSHDGMLKGLFVGTGCVGGPVAQTVLNSGVDAAVRMAWALASWFPQIGIELQHHHIADLDHSGVSDTEIRDGLWEVAQRSGLPVILGRDNHYVLKEERPVHDALKQLVSWSDDPDEAGFNGDGYHMLDTEGMRPYFTPEMFDAGMAGLTDLANRAYVRLPEMETFTLKVPDVTVARDPQEVLEEKVFAAMPEVLKKKKTYLQPLKHELDVIRVGQMASYLLLVAKVCDFMREKEIRWITRGSAAGSQVVRFLGIHDLDPIALGLRDDRFLSSNRLKPPDIDLDVEHQRRSEVVDFLYDHWPVLPVGNHRKHKISVEDDGEGDESKGSLKVRYYSVLRKRGLPIPAMWRDIPRAERDMLVNLADRQLFAGYGKHAAGYIVAPNEEVLAQLPHTWIASSATMITSFAKKDIESLGYLKLDLLGSKAQTAVALMEKSSGVAFDEIPLKDKETYRLLAAGETTGVFQFEGWSMTKGTKRLKPRNIEDVIAAQALFRPAAERSGAVDEFLDRRFKRQEIPTRHADIMSATAGTYGVLLYQEQVMDVMSSLGLDNAELEEMLDAVKASNEYTIGAAETIARLAPRMRSLAAERGWSEADVEWLLITLKAYADYSFNRAHAAAYGIVAYRMAWMRTHQPLHFWAAMLAASDADKDRVMRYQIEARRTGTVVRRSHVNHSAVSFSIDADGVSIRKGLITVRGVGIIGATELAAHAPYASLNDLARKVLPRRVSGVRQLLLGTPPGLCGGMIDALYEADALVGLEFEPKEESDGPGRDAAPDQRKAAQGRKKPVGADRAAG